MGPLPNLAQLSQPRQRVITEMAFNMGLKGLMEFKELWKAVQVGNWDEAASAMLNSLWAKEVGQRAIRLATTMRTGVEVMQEV